MRSTGGSHIKKEQANGERHADAAASSAAGSESLHVRLFMEHEDRRERQKKREEAEQLRKCPSHPDISKSQASGPVVRCESYGGASEITIPPEAKGTITPPQQGTITPPPDPVELREVPSAPIAAPAPASESSTAKRASDRFNNLYKDNEIRQRRWLARHEAKCRQEEETLRKQRGRSKGTRTFDKGSFHDWYERNAKRYFEAERHRQAQQELREQERIAEELAACRFNTQATFEKSTGGSSISTAKDS
jgi:AraC-like DNA-binding protein